ncbi:MAG: hypothetical protein LBL90_02015 [Prevotellaceae bacterium]|jgi:hypothetical protein|nr:hypothetical protein [Prevotellaceae bacterium]
MKNTSKITIIVMVLSFVTMASTCNHEDENNHHTIQFINQSDKPIYVVGSGEYPDTLNVQGMDGGGLSQSQWSKIYPNTQNKTALQRRSAWEYIFKNKERIFSDTLMVYVFDAELLESRDTHIYNTIIQRYDLSLQDLQYVNWMLIYPPSPNMSAIKMYPPYGK